MTQGQRLKKLAQLSLLPLASLALGCSSDGTDGEDAHNTISEVDTRPVWGMVLGALADPGTAEHPNPVNIRDNAGAIACDLKSLGMKWVRADVGFGNGLTPEGLEPFRKFIRAAHVAQQSVLVVVHPPNFGCAPADTKCQMDKGINVDAWGKAYVDTLNKLIQVELTGDAAANAYEIGNEPNNLGENFVHGSAFAYLMNRVWNEVKLPRAKRDQEPLIVNGGILNTYQTDEPDFWNAMWQGLQAGEPPFDVFSVHPYNMAKYGAQKSRTAWRDATRQHITDIRAKIKGMYPSTFPGDAKPTLWATETGWISGGKNGAQEQSELFTYTDTTLAGLISVAFWYDYRDDENVSGTQYSSYGVRWSSEGAYRPKAIYKTIAARTGAPGDAQACYPNVALDCTPDPDGAADCGPARGVVDKDDETETCFYSKDTKTAVAGKFYRFWKENGHIPVFGYPISVARCAPNTDPNTKGTDPNFYSQWFERQLMEYHPKAAGTQFEIALGLVGRKRVDTPKGNSLDPNGNFVDQSGKECREFPETGQKICGELLHYYAYNEPKALPSAPKSKLSPLELLGFPITPEFWTKCPVGGDVKDCRVQYTERARLEVHYSEFAPDSKDYVQQGLLGRELM